MKPYSKIEQIQLHKLTAAVMTDPTNNKLFNEWYELCMVSAIRMSKFILKDRIRQFNIDVDMKATDAVHKFWENIFANKYVYTNLSEGLWYKVLHECNYHTKKSKELSFDQFLESIHQEKSNATL